MFPPSNSFNPFQFANDHNTENQIPISLEEVIHLPNSPFIGDADDFFSCFQSEQHEDQQKVSDLGSSLANEEAQEEETFPEASNNKAVKIKDKKRVTSRSGEKKPVPRKRTGKKDRHSKIYTAQGPRDRRMRLSLPIARKFFDLQDILGFDKASKTIEWLLKKSKTAIIELKQGFPGVKSSNFSVFRKSVSSTSESEVVSGVKLMMGQGENSLAGTPKEKRSKGLPKQYFNPVARESREKARARARERTREKMTMKGLDMTNQSSQTNPNSSDAISPCRHVEDGEYLGLEHGARVEEVSYHLLQQQMDSASILEKLWGSSTSAPRLSSSVDLGYFHSLEAPGEANILDNEISGFPGKWVINNDSNNLVHALKLTTGKFHVHDNNPVLMNDDPLAQEKNPPISLFMSTSNSEAESFSNPNNGNPSPIPLTTTNTNFSSYPIGIQFSDIHLSKHGSLYGSL